MVALQDNQFDLNDEAFRHAYGATAQWLHNINASNQAGLFAQYSRLKFIGNEFRNAERSIIGFNGAHVFKGDWYSIIFGGQLSFSSRWQLFGTLTAELHDNDEQDLTFLKKRKDHQYDTSIGLNFAPVRDWLIKPQITYTKNDSNIELNSFDRTNISVTARKDFSW